MTRVAKRLGYTVTDLSALSGRKRIMISDGKKMFLFDGKDVGFYPTTTRWQAKLMGDKRLAQHVLQKLKQKTIPSRHFSIADYPSKAALTKAVLVKKISYPVITKINTGTYGRGITYITNERELKRSLAALHTAQTDFMIQRVLTHDEYRITFIEHTPVMVHKKRLPRIEGNGTDTITTLLAAHPKDLKDENFIKDQLKKQGLKPGHILGEGKILETHIIKKRTPEYYKVSGFPKSVVTWGKSLLQTVSASTMAVDFMAPNGLDHPEDFIIIELNANPNFSYVIDELGDTKTPERLMELILKKYFGKHPKSPKK